MIKTMIMKPLITVITPAFNEESIIYENLSSIYDYMDSLNSQYEFELIVINDGSTDKTGELIEQFAKAHPKTKVIHHLVNLNLGNALKTGFKYAKGNITVVLDLDLSYDVTHIGRLIDTINVTQADIVLASPYMPGGKVTAVPFFRKLLSKWANKFLRLAAQEKFHTYTGMVRAYKTEFLQSLNLKTKDYEINPEIIYKAMILRARIIEIPAHLDWTLQIKQKSKRSSGMKIFKSFLSSIMSGFIYRPYIYFLGIGMILLILSIYIIVWIFVNTFILMPQLSSIPEFYGDRFTYAVAEVFRGRPYSFFVGGFTFIAAIQFLSLGFISLQNKRYFEELFHINTSILKAKSPPEINYESS
jgi:glycosyltransferase involved in cell wall biosynthesis